MKKIIFTLFIIGFTSSPLLAGTVPLEHFAQKSQFKDFKISPDGKHIAFTYDDETEVKLGIMRLSDKKVIMSFGPDGDNREIDQFFWATNDRIIMLNTKITGWLDGQSQEPRLVAGNIDGSKRYELWNFERSGVNILSMLEDDPKHILVGKYHFTDDGEIRLHRMNIYNGEMKFISGAPKTVGSSKSKVRGLYVDSQDEAKAAIEIDPVNEDDFNDDVAFLHFKSGEEWKLLDLPMKRTGRPDISGVGFNEAGTTFYFLSNHDLDHDGVRGLFELDLASGKSKFLYRHPDVDVIGPIRGPNSEVIGVYLEPGYPEYYYLQDAGVKSEVKFHKALRSSFKNEDISLSSYTSDGKTATLRVTSDKNPGDFYLFDRASNQAKYIGSAMPQIKPKDMSVVEPFKFKARDGLEMYGQMTIPNGKKLKNLPLIIYPHGGPYGAFDTWRWSARPQMLANNGYLVIQLNYRGSGRYGMDFYEEGKGEWGGKMQDDLTDVTNWAIQQGYADKNRVCIHGVSYGGYAAMQAVVKEPDLYQCSIPDAGVYEFALQWNKADSFQGRRKAGANYMQWAIGGTDDATVKRVSPAYHVDKLKAALFLVHGTEDVRVPIDNAYFLENKLKEAGKPYQTMYKKDGHGFQKVEYRVELYKKMLDFLDEHIGEK